MTRTFIRYYCCPWCKGSRDHMRQSRRGQRNLRRVHREHIRRLRHNTRARLRRGDYEPEILSYPRLY